MKFVLDASIALSWLLVDGKASDRRYAQAVLEAMKSPDAADAATFSRSLADVLQLARRYRLSSYDASYLELALRAGLPLATLDADLQMAAKKAGTRRFDPL